MEQEGRRYEAKPEEWSLEVQDDRCRNKVELEGRGSPAELVDCQAMMEWSELGAMVESTGQWAEAESGPRRLEAESRETMITATLEDCTPTELAPHRWWAEGEQRGFQTTLVEEAGVGGPANTGGRSGGAGSGGRLRGAVTGWRSGGAGSRRSLQGRR